MSQEESQRGQGPRAGAPADRGLERALRRQLRRVARRARKLRVGGRVGPARALGRLERAVARTRTLLELVPRPLRGDRHADLTDELTWLAGLGASVAGLDGLLRALPAYRRGLDAPERAALAPLAAALEARRDAAWAELRADLALADLDGLAADWRGFPRAADAGGKADDESVPGPVPHGTLVPQPPPGGEPLPSLGVLVARRARRRYRRLRRAARRLADDEPGVTLADLGGRARRLDALLDALGDTLPAEHLGPCVDELARLAEPLERLAEHARHGDLLRATADALADEPRTLVALGALLAEVAARAERDRRRTRSRLERLLRPKAHRRFRALVRAGRD